MFVFPSGLAGGNEARSPPGYYPAMVRRRLTRCGRFVAYYPCERFGCRISSLPCRDPGHHRPIQDRPQALRYLASQLELDAWLTLRSGVYKRC